MVRLEQALRNHEDGYKNEYFSSNFSLPHSVELKLIKRTHYFTVASVNFWTCCQKMLWKQIPAIGSDRNWISSCTPSPNKGQ